ncbi:hypothetical protein LOK49_Contig152G00006 [Camellia lanceoleosa]|nr:hypothetical protein LOK49_Contig152G00006 [Camellia lanceoleosa]
MDGTRRTGGESVSEIGIPTGLNRITTRRESPKDPLSSIDDDVDNLTPDLPLAATTPGVENVEEQINDNSGKEMIMKLLSTENTSEIASKTNLTRSTQSARAIDI